jgi:hypothetical protein
VGEIRGFKFLTRAARLRLKPFLAGHLRRRLTEKSERHGG